jgi:acyl-CoA synthetase (AMP-forming)/AMP-acid ligase II
MRLALAKALEIFKKRIAIITEDGDIWSYARLAEEARAIAKSIPPAQLVVIEGDNCPATIAAYLAVLINGGLAYFDDPRSGHALGPAFGPHIKIKCEGEVARIEVDNDGNSATPINPDIVILFGTSGSTGARKLVKITDGNILSNTRSIIEYLGLTAEDRAITSLKPRHAFGLSVINAQLLSGGALLLTDRSVQDTLFWSFARANKVTILPGVPHIYEVLAKRTELDNTPSLRLLIQAGGKLRPELVSAYARRGELSGWRFCVMYGQTEAAPRMAYLPPELAASAPDSIGIAIPGGTLSLEDETGRLIDEPEVEGELIYRGPNVMAGYAVERADLAYAVPGERLATGDIAKRREDGLFVIVGRISRFIKPLGYRIGLDDVEALLAESNIVAAAVAHGEGLFIAREDGPHIDATSVASALGLPASYVTLRMVQDLPRLASGKIDYVSVGKFAGERAHLWLPSHFLCYVRETAIEAWNLLKGGYQDHDIAACYTTALRRPVTSNDSFKSLGGDSLSYVELLILLEGAFGPLPDEWIHMTIGELEHWQRGIL